MIALKLEYVCQYLLDNCDLQLNLSDFPKIELVFNVFGKVDSQFYKVIFLCNQVIHFEITTDDDDDLEAYLVLDVKVTQTIKKHLSSAIQDSLMFFNNNYPVWEISIFGDCLIKIVTTAFDWQLQTLSETEYSQRYD